MSGIIPREFIDDLLTRVDIVDVIHQRVPLKKKGREFMACCPFHHEKTPSFSVSPTKQFYHCFGCGVHGSAITFLMEYEHQEFVESIETLARSVGVEVPREKVSPATQAKRQQAGDLYTLLDHCRQYYQQQLPGNAAAKEYLQQRGLDQSIVDRFKLGFAPDGWDNVIKLFGRQYTSQQLIDAGLAIQNDSGKVYDRFRDRIMYPIHDRRGRTIGFGGRVITSDDGPKYLNSPETPVFHKGQELFGLYEARQHTRKLDRLLVVEGYMDVIALAQYEITYAVATLGTATTRDHVTQIFRLVDEAIFCFDGDRAGREAAWRAVENTLPVMRDGKEIRFMFLPTGEDPDSQVRKIGKEAFEQSLVNESVSLTDYLIEHTRKQFNLSSKEGRARFLDHVGGLLKQMPDSLIREQLISDVALMSSVSEEILKQKKFGQNVSQNRNQGVDEQPGNIYPNRQPSIARLGDREIRRTPIRFTIAILLSNPSFVSFIDNPEQIAMYDLPGVGFLSTLIETIEESPHINSAVLLERWRGTEYEPVIVNLLSSSYESCNDETLVQEFKDSLKQIHKQAQQKKLEHLLYKEQIEGLSEQDKVDLQALLLDIHA